MFELICLLLSAAATALISVTSGWYSDLGWLWKVPLLEAGLYIGVALVFFIAVFFLSLSVDIEKPIDKPSKFFAFVYHFFLSFLNRFFRVKICVEGEENLPDGPCLFIMNHRSNFDPMIVADKYKKRKILMISKKSNFKIPFAGGVIHRAGYMAIDRENDREALKTIIKAAGYLKQGYSIGIFPEGTRNKQDLNVHPFKHGAFKAATKAGVPIVITAIHQTQLIHKNFPLKSTRAYIHFLKTITPEEYAGKSTTELSDLAISLIQADIDAFESAKSAK